MKKNWEGTIPIYINNYNHLTTTRKMAEYFDDIPGTDIVIVDNNSTYPPLLEWYKNCKYKVELLGKNGKHHAPWNCGVILNPIDHKKKYGSDYYVVTDADLEINSCPIDLLDILIDGITVHDVVKAGLGIEINDLPDGCPSKNYVHSWEIQHWKNKSLYLTSNKINFYNTCVDTTFALYRIYETNPKSICPAIRSGRPYVARHNPWYITKENINEEYKFIIESYPSPGSHMDCQDWINHLRPLL